MAKIWLPHKNINISKPEAFKTLYDFFKHLTTLNTAAILLLVTLIEKLFSTNKEWSFCIGISFVCFIFSIIFSLLSMLACSGHVSEGMQVDDYDVNIFMARYYFAFIPFVLGLISIAVFSMKNFYESR